MSWRRRCICTAWSVNCSQQIATCMHLTSRHVLSFIRQLLCASDCFGLLHPHACTGASKLDWEIFSVQFNSRFKKKKIGTSHRKRLKWIGKYDIMYLKVLKRGWFHEVFTCTHPRDQTLHFFFFFCALCVRSPTWLSLNLLCPPGYLSTACLMAASHLACYFWLRPHYALFKKGN